MRKLDLDKKTGFVVKDTTKPIIIRDNRGILFYTTEPLLPKVKCFNLPIGNYFVETGSFVAMEKPRKYKLASMPFPERRKKRPDDFKIIFEKNPNKCSVFWDRKTIVFDNSFKEKPLPQLFFVLYHEYGHHLYNTERYADLYASNLMKVRGYNPSQIASAHMHSLGSAQYDRKKYVTEKLIKTI